MDKPTIVSVKRADEESEVPPERAEPNEGEKPQPTKAAQEQKETAASVEQTSANKPANPQNEQPKLPDKRVGTEGLTNLERSVLEEMKKRGELSEQEEQAILSEAKNRQATPSPQTRRQERKEKGRPAEVEVASEEQKPRVIAGAPPWVARQAKPLIKQTRVNGVVVKQDGEPVKQEAQAPDEGGYTPEERQRAADLARRIYERKQREKSIFYKIKRALGLVKEEPLVQGE